MATRKTAARRASAQGLKHLTAEQLAAAFRLAAALRAFLDGESERITLVGPFAHRQRCAPRHAPEARFERWRRQGGAS